MRDVFGRALLEARRGDPRVFVLDGDCAHSTRSGWVGDQYPESFLNAGIAEQNMIGMAAGLALAGLRPVVCGFAAIVVGRAAEQIILSIALPRLPVTIVGHYAGLSAAMEGAPHHAITDIAFLRAVPGMTIWIPADDHDVLEQTARAINTQGPSYLRLNRDPVPRVEGDERIADALRLWHRPDSDITLVACGSAVGQCVRAAQRLAKQSITASVIGVLRLKPAPELELLGLLLDSPLVMTVEEHNIIGGLGGAVAELMATQPVRRTRLLRHGVPDSFTETGPYPQLLARFRLDADSIAARARRALEEGA